MGALIARTALSTSSDGIDPSGLHSLAQIPDTLATMLSKFHLEGHVVIYAVCPACHCTFKPEYKKGSETPIYSQ